MKKKKDRKYQKSDQKICDFGNEIMRKEARKIDIKNVEIYSGARVSRATFSRHYQCITDIKIREENRILCDFHRHMGLGDNRETVIFKFVLTLYKNKGFFAVLVKRNDIFLLKKMILEMNRLITRGWRSYGRETDRVLENICVYFVMAIVEEWARRRFRGDFLEREVGLISEMYDFLEDNQGDLGRIFAKWEIKHPRQKRQMVV